jgi:hypothetical protein
MEKRGGNAEAFEKTGVARKAIRKLLKRKGGFGSKETESTEKGLVLGTKREAATTEECMAGGSWPLEARGGRDDPFFGGKN